ncbi:MAG: hypothetical protein ACP5M9_03140 [Candidatus Micrarchaeia archaeon]
MNQENIYENKTLSILLTTFSIILLAGGILNLSFFSTQYGLGAGALLVSGAYNKTVIPLLSYEASQTSFFSEALLETYIIIIIGFVLFVTSFILWLHRQNGYERYLRIYVPLHIILVFVYTMLLFIVYSAFNFNDYTLTLDLIYLSILGTLLIDSYIGYKNYIKNNKIFSNVGINPNKPYSNIINLKEKIFSNLNGDVCIVDKHFNSKAIENLYRLVSDNKNIKALTVITSNEMLDSSFTKDYRDLKNELLASNIIFDVKIMNDGDSVQQHERFIFDSEKAYKIPPLNIINKKSEHIVKISRREASKRFEELILKSKKVD